MGDPLDKKLDFKNWHIFQKKKWKLQLEYKKHNVCINIFVLTFKSSFTRRKPHFCIIIPSQRRQNLRTTGIYLFLLVFLV